MDTRPIGIFDSGFGGLTVLDELVNQLPTEKFIYFGDVLRVPYGTKEVSDVIEYSVQTLRWFEKRDLKAIVVACNTTSAVAISTLRSLTSTPLFGMVDPGVETVMSWSELSGVDIHKLAIIGTKNTINSRIHENRFRTEGFTGEIYPVACSLFSQIIHEGVMDKHIWMSTINYYLSRLRDINIDGLLLACTSYPLVSEYLQEYFGGKVQIFNPNFMVAKGVASYLLENDLENDERTEQCCELYITGMLEAFSHYYNRHFHFEGATIKVAEL
jgi:glutamate racemase